MRTFSIAGFVLFLTATIAIAQQPKILSEFTGKAIGATDGDMIKVMVDKETIIVRLEGIDAPEAGQAYGPKAKETLAKLVDGKMVTIKKTGEDRDKRTLGIVMIDGVDVNATLVEQGCAWHFKKYSKDENLARLEEAAKQAKRGLWADPNPTPPWEYRKQKTTPPADTKPATP